MKPKLRDDCFLTDEERLTHAEAVAILRERVSPVVATEQVKVDHAAGRTLAEPVIASRPIPAHSNAAVDGYALAHDDYDADEGSALPVVGRAAAGHPFDGSVCAGAAIRIFTGAEMPKGLESVVMQEDVTLEETDGRQTVHIPPGLKKGANCRLAGEDVGEGEQLLAPGIRMRPQDVASAAAAGHAHLTCFAPLKVAFFSTGDEVIRPGTPLGPSQVYDANAPMLNGLIAAAGAEPVDLGVLPDNAEAVEQALRDASGKYNVLVTSGGASRGEEDHVVNAIDALGSLRMWQIAIKPGRPMAFGQIGDCVFLGLPGNPVAVFVCFLLYVRPTLVALGGGTWPEPVRYPLKSSFKVEKKKTGRREFWRAFLAPSDDGLRVQKFPRDGSGLISSLRAADGLVEISEDADHVAEGDEVTFIPFSEFGIGR